MNYHQRWLGFSILLLSCSLATNASEANDSVDSYQNQIVSTAITVQGRGLLHTDNITVTPSGYLKLNAPDGIMVTGPFTVELGGKLELNGGWQWPVGLMYDSTGNIIRRYSDQ